MYDQKPTTSLMEDLEVLGLVKPTQGGRRRLNEMGDDMQPDPSLAQGQPGAHAEPDGDEAPAGVPGAPGAPAAKTPPFPSKGAPMKPADDDQGDKDMMGMGAPAPNHDAQYDMAPDQEMQAYESAWDVVKQYYGLSERNERLSEDDYKTVINAMGFIIETQGKYLKLEPDHDPDELPAGNFPSWAGDSENNPIEKVDGTGAMRQPKGWRYHDASPRPSEKAESLNNLVGQLRALTQQQESDDEAQALGSRIIEGFEAIRDTATEVANGLAAELKESNERVTADHPRLRLGKYFEGVGNDARLLLKAISENHTTDIDDAIEDLNSLARDLKRGLAQL
ncbi:MAG: hypothetical protein AB7L09_00285 [Nitrospira sp.]